MKPTDYPVERYTRGQAFKKAVTQAALIAGWPTALIFTVLLLRLDERLFKGTMPPERVAQEHTAAFYIATFVFCWFFFGGGLVTYMHLRNTPSRREMADRYRKRLSDLEDAQ